MPLPYYQGPRLWSIGIGSLIMPPYVSSRSWSEESIGSNFVAFSHSTLYWTFTTKVGVRQAVMSLHFAAVMGVIECKCYRVLICILTLRISALNVLNAVLKCICLGQLPVSWFEFLVNCLAGDKARRCFHYCCCFCCDCQCPYCYRDHHLHHHHL